MDPVSRLTMLVRWVGVLLGLLCVVVGARAACEPQTVKEYQIVYPWQRPGGANGTMLAGNGSGPWSPSPEAACSAGGGGYMADNTGVGTRDPGNGYTLTQTMAGTASMRENGYCYFVGTMTLSRKPPGDSPSEVSVYPTEVGFSMPTRTVTKPCDECSQYAGKAGAAGYVTAETGSKVPPSSMCIGNCGFNIGSGSGWVSGSKDGKWFHTTEGSNTKGTGQGCTAIGDGNPTPRPEPLKPGRCPGQVNNVDVPGGVPCGETAETKAPTKSESAASSASSPDGAKPGSVQETKGYGCIGSRCTTTTTTTTDKDDGTTESRTEVVEEDKADFCQRNKTSKLCAEEGDKSTWGGSCGAFTCGGDAVMCAMALDQHKRNCELFSDSEASARGQSAAAAGDRPGDHPRNGVEVVSLANGFDQTDLLAGTCPADEVIPLGGGRSVTLSLSKLCTPAGWLGNVLVGITALACLGIVFKG